MLQGIDLRTLYSLASHLGSSASELAALLQNEAQVQTSTYEAWKIDNPGGETKKKPSDRVNALFRACCRSCRSRDEPTWEGWTSATAERVCSQHPGVPGAHGRVQQDPIACKGDMPWAMQQFTPNLPALSLAQTWYRKPFHFPQPQTSLLRSKPKSWSLLSSPWRSAPEKRCCMSVWSWKWRRENTKHPSGYYHLLRLGRRSPGPTTGIQHVCGQKAAVGVSAQHPVGLLKCWPFYLLLIFKYSDKRANVSFSASNFVTVLLFLMGLKIKDCFLFSQMLNPYRHVLRFMCHESIPRWIKEFRCSASKGKKKSLLTALHEYPTPATAWHILSRAAVGVGSTGPFTSVAVFRASHAALLQGC